MNNPVTTYRIQFHKDFTLTNLEEVSGYLKELGVSTIYASPIFEAAPGSEHGYDGVNPHNINPEIGTEEQLKKISNNLNEAGLQWLQDIVPNHMAFHHQNKWLMDVLEKGPLSAYAQYFDTSLCSSFYHGRIMIPFLGSSLQDVIKNGELNLGYDDRIVFKYYENVYPVNPRSYAKILQSDKGLMNEAIRQILDQIEYIKHIEDANEYSKQWDEILLQLSSLMKDEKTQRQITSLLDQVNKEHALLQQIADQQIYRFCNWQETDNEINYRRFFTVNSLICLNIQVEDVFHEYHKTIKRYVDEGVFQGLRIDHIDGLFDPAGYLNQLRHLAGKDTYIVVEKILAPDESLSDEWPIQGNTGYDFLSVVNNLLSDRRSSKSFSKFYQKLIGDKTAVHKQLREKKKYILYTHMNGELSNLYHYFLELNLADQAELSEIEAELLKEAIGEFLIHFPVYRYYGNKFPLSEGEAEDLRNIFSDIKKNKEHLIAAIQIIETALLKNSADSNETFRKNALAFYQRCMQFTGPLMAKGVEDTLMYTYARFIGHNEVGDSPETFGYSIAEFHEKMIERQVHWPLSINATSTHDTKRGEDVRARLNVLTDLSDEWTETVQEWMQLNKDLKTGDTPSSNIEYFIYQTMIGTYPMPGEGEDDYSNRIEEYLQKALREAKEHSNWTTPDTEYEEATAKFALQLLDKNTPFWESFQKFHAKVADYGIINSLSQVILKFTSPGVPDVYQGCELWDLSLVDPDNRRFVDYDQRRQFIKELEQGNHDGLILDLWKNRYNGKIKLWLVQKLMKERKQYSKVFSEGQYIPLEVKGELKDNVLAFARRYKQQWYVVAIPLHIAGLSNSKNDPLKVRWKGTKIVLPAEAPSNWQNILLNTEGSFENEIELGDIVEDIPFVILKLESPVSKRSAGILMAISSLPSNFGIGDFGPQARAFADFLSRSKQSYWQILPLTPTEMGQHHSPYSSTSIMAGNPLLISPEWLAANGLLDAEDLSANSVSKKKMQVCVDYIEVERIKGKLFDKAFENFCRNKEIHFAGQFNEFCKKEEEWLNDFALYQVLKTEFQGKPWFEWPVEFKLRDGQSLEHFADIHSERLDHVKWVQFIFDKQWKELRAYCNALGIKLLGDIPFYTSYDSVDVWANPDIFSLDENRNMIGVAGVPPDYFNADGQLWGMPVFMWDKLKKTGYRWWVNRLRKNLELYDEVRLDHFRAFSAYWEVPASEQTARNGEWKPGPGAHFFSFVKKEMGKLPFIAEDLGDIDDDVYQLRDRFKFPGMKVLQFAFGDDMAQSLNIPHNYTQNFFVYTGTHDNNTTVGWYRKDASKANKRQLKQYVSGPLKEKNVHKVLARLAYSSVAKTVILPLQDILGLDESARMNTPASIKNNWLWRLKPGQLSGRDEKRLRKWTTLTNR